MKASTEPSRAVLETGYAGLDLIRFGAAVMVVLYHLINVGPGRAGDAGESFRAAFAPVAPFTASFWVAVPIFFVLSGFVIAFSAEGRSAGEFVRRRVLRLYPAAWICASITACVVWWHWPQPDMAARYLRSITLFPRGPWISDVYWTLAVEVTFYAMIALVLALGGSRWVVRLGIVLALTSCAWWGLRIINLLAGSPIDGLLDGLAVLDAFLLLRHGAYFALGILLFAIARGGRRLTLFAFATIAGFASLAAVISTARSFDPDSPSLLDLTLAPAIWLTGLAAIVVSMLSEGRSQPLSRRRFVRSVGLATYPLYLVHAELGVAVMLMLAPLGHFLALAATLAFLLAAVAIIQSGERVIRRALEARHVRRAR